MGQFFGNKHHVTSLNSLLVAVMGGADGCEDPASLKLGGGCFLIGRFVDVRSGFVPKWVGFSVIGGVDAPNLGEIDVIGGADGCEDPASLKLGCVCL